MKWELTLLFMNALIEICLKLTAKPWPEQLRWVDLRFDCSSGHIPAMGLIPWSGHVLEAAHPCFLIFFSLSLPLKNQ